MRHSPSEVTEMNGRLAKKLRQISKRNWRQYIAEIKELPFTVRWRIAWFIIFGSKRKV